MNLLLLIYILASFSSLIVADVHDWFSNTTCAIRFDQVAKVKNSINCTLVKTLNHMCNKGITIGYSELPPYVFTRKNGSVDGLLPRILKSVLVDTCCLGCTKVTYHPYDGYKLIYDAIIPRENGLNSETYYGYPYTTLSQLKTVTFFGKNKKHEPVNLISELFKSIGKTWSLLVVALSMAVCSGTLIWIMDTWFNKTEFPRPFIRGSFEGFWWAFVSMTTVGYGDRTPRSIIARLFAIFWILLGITIFNMYTAAITSSLTAEITKSTEFDLHGKEVGVLANSTAPYSGVLLNQAHPRAYNSIEELKKALSSDEVTAVAFEGYMAMHYTDEFKRISDEIGVIKKTALVKNGIGLVSTENIVQLIKSFAVHNEDSIDVVIAQAMTNIVELTRSEEVIKDTYSPTNEAFYASVIITLSAAVICMLVGATMSYFKAKMKNKQESKHAEKNATQLNDYTNN